MGKNKRKHNFEVVPVGYKPGGAGKQGKRAANGKGTNTLRNAHAGSMRKQEELWFRKCGHGERLHASYYRKDADGAVPVKEWSAFEAVLRRKLPVTFRFRPGCDAGARAKLEERLRALGTVAPVRWAPAADGI